LSSGSTISLGTQVPTLELHWGNVGKAVARYGRFTVFTLHDNDSGRQNVGTGDIIGAGTNVFPGMGTTAHLPTDPSTLLEKLLVCITFVDERGASHEQATMFKLPPDARENALLIEQPPPNIALCH